MFQIRAVTIILISSAGIGATQGFSNTAAVVYVDKNLTTLPEILNDEEISWLSIQSLQIVNFKIPILEIHFLYYISVSILQGTVMIFLLIGGFLNELIGRKKTMLLGQTCILAGWLVVYFSKLFEVLLLGRFFNAMGIGFTFSSGVLLLSEIALVRMRGTLTMMNALMVNFGIIYALVLYAIFSMDKIIIMSALPSILFLLTSFFLPESPMWLMKKGKIDEAKV